MPIGGHTPDSPQPHTPSTPPPTDSGVCAISPSDLVGYTGNLINRVNELEQRIAELEAANVEANQLSDISQQIGWAEVDYLGVSGWQQTSYGTLIPPAGFTLLGGGLTMSDGNSYSAVVYDEDGVLQYGFGQVTPTGEFTAVTGVLGAGMGQNMAVVTTTDEIVDAGSPVTGNDSIVPDLDIYANPNGIIALNGATDFKVTQSGFYSFHYSQIISITSTNANGSITATWQIGSQTAFLLYPNRAIGPTIVVRGNTGGLTTGGLTYTSANVNWLQANVSTVHLNVGITGTGTTANLINKPTLVVSLVRATSSPTS